MSKESVLIIGSSSFAGASMVDFLISKKKYNVYGTYRRKKNKAYLPYLRNSRKIKFKNIKVDFTKNPKKLINVILKFKPRYIIDFASICMVNQSWENPETYININILYKSFLLRNLKKFKFLKKYIYISTPEIFGSSKLIKENCNIYNPSTPYATSKLCFEMLLKNFAKNFNAPIIIARFSNFFGPGQPVYRLIPKLITCIDNEIKFPLEGKGQSKRNYIFSYDFCNGIHKIMSEGKIKNIYHFSGSEDYKTTDIIKILCQLKSYNFKKLIKITKRRAGQDLNYKLDCKKTKKELNWRPLYPFKKALKLVIDYQKTASKQIKKESLKYMDNQLR